jgi:HK97 gp10 family phage protein
MARRPRGGSGVSAARTRTTATFDVVGLKEFEASLAELGKATARNVMNRALTESAAPIQEIAEAKAPKRSGNLAGKIVVSARSTSTAGKKAFSQAMRGGASRVAAGQAARAANKGARGRDTFSQVFVGPSTDAWYGIFSEFGTVNHAAQPFMRPAFDEGAPKSLDRLTADLASEIDKAAQRAARKSARLARRAAG